MEAIKAQVPPHADIDCHIMDKTSLDIVRNFATQFLARGLPLHLLINNAGIMNTPFSITVNGFEEQFQVNHLSHFLLTHLLFPALTAATVARVVNLASRAHLRWNQKMK